MESLSLWLEAVSSAAVQEEVEVALNDEKNLESYLDAVFAHLTARQISEACVLAQDKGMAVVSLLFSFFTEVSCLDCQYFFFLSFINVIVILFSYSFFPTGDHHLALLLAQTCFGQDAPREILAQQLANWAEGGTDALMAPPRLSLYALMAAAPTHQASHTTVNTCQGLDWRRALGLHLW